MNKDSSYDLSHTFNDNISLLNSSSYFLLMTVEETFSCKTKEMVSTKRIKAAVRGIGGLNTAVGGLTSQLLLMILSSMSVMTMAWMTVIPNTLVRILCRMSNLT